MHVDVNIKTHCKLVNIKVIQLFRASHSKQGYIVLSWISIVHKVTPNSILFLVVFAKQSN